MLEGLVPTQRIFGILPVERPRRLTVRVWNPRREQWDVTGIADALKASQGYPPDFGLAVVQATDA